MPGGRSGVVDRGRAAGGRPFCSALVRRPDDPRGADRRSHGHRRADAAGALEATATAPATPTFYPGRSAAVSIVPTGIGCSVGGFAGDAAPATHLLAATVDYLVTHPNAVNASDFVALDRNVLYTEGYMIDLLCHGLVDLFVPYSNRVGLIIEKSDPARIELAYNVVNAVRAVHGVSIDHVVVTSETIGSRCEENASGAFVGTSTVRGCCSRRARSCSAGVSTRSP
ncbi:MAG: DUF3326 domain-containing protein [Thermoanaerobaculia bacterium]|nr:DUF3326 domain-containing protein [Thermoanaerobaculia bacterium]